MFSVLIILCTWPHSSGCREDMLVAMDDMLVAREDMLVARKAREALATRDNQSGSPGLKEGIRLKRVAENTWPEECQGHMA